MRNLTLRNNKNIGRKRQSRGFTLIEILVVVVIIGILGAVIVPNLLGRPDQARVTAAKSDIRNLSNALDIYRLDNFVYPSTEQGIEALVSAPSGFPEPKNYNPDGYIKNLPTDPWGSPYVYERTQSGFTLFSLGADGTEGGEGLNADIRIEDI
jgi:general secretion pathway protein G